MERSTDRLIPRIPGFLEEKVADWWLDLLLQGDEPGRGGGGPPSPGGGAAAQVEQPVDGACLDHAAQEPPEGSPPLDPAGRVVIVVDNGVATGATMIAALEGARISMGRRDRP